MNSFPEGFRALIIGARGGIGQAFVHALQANPRCASAVALSRQSVPRIDFDDKASVADAVQALAAGGKSHLIINAAGLLHSADFMPEKKLAIPVCPSPSRASRLAARPR